MNTTMRLLLTQGITSLAGILLAAWLLNFFESSLSLLKLAGLAVVLGFGLSWLLLRPLARRLSRVGKIVQAWNWGSLDLRIADRRGDDLGNTAVLLDQLVDHFEQDERDLDELRQRNMLLTDQVRALTVVEERNRLARELHDSVKQHLFSLAMTLSAVRTQLEGLQQIPEDLKTMVEDVESSAQTAQRETTRLIGDLRPGSLQERGLAVSLNDFTLLFGAKEHLLVYLDVQGQEPSLAPLVAEALYRVAQEALHNVARHAQATRVDLQLQYLPGRVRLALQDNGIGFDVSQPSRGLGLANMQERMMEVGGRLDIESQYGRGTCITAEVDLVAARERQQAEILEQGQTALIPTMDHWPWLGQKLVIPVGQTWPWLPADTAHLRQPLVELVGVPLIFKSEPRLLGLRKCCRFEMGSQPDSWVRIRHTWRGFSWKCDGARWQLHNYGGLSRRMVLFRNGQPVAALQYRGRQLHAWSEVVYDGRGYRISQDAKTPERYILRDHTGDLLLTVHHKISTEVTLERPLPVQLIILVALRILEENLFYPK